MNVTVQFDPQAKRAPERVTLLGYERLTPTTAIAARDIAAGTGASARVTDGTKTYRVVGDRAWLVREEDYDMSNMSAVDTRCQTAYDIGADMWNSCGDLDVAAAIRSYGSIEAAAKACAEFHDDSLFVWVDYDGTVLNAERYVMVYLSEASLEGGA
jgi:hypothetical protein